MPLPAPLVGLTVRGKVITADNIAIQGATVTLTPQVPAQSPAGDVLIPPKPRPKTSVADGTVEWTDLLATDSPGLSNRVPYTLLIVEAGKVLQGPITVELLSSQAVGGVLRLDDVVPATPPVPLASYVLQASVGAVGGPGGPLGADGKLPAAQLPAAGGSIPATLVDAKGDLVTATANDTPARLAVGADGRVLMADAAQTTGLKWQALGIADVASLQATLDGKIAVALVDAKGDLLVGSAADTIVRLAAGSTGQVLAADSAQAAGVKWAPPSAGVVYPLQEGYGFHSASVLPDNAKSTSGFAGWQTRIWVPADKVIAKAGMFVTTAAVGTASLAAFAVYSDDGQTQLGATAHDNTLFQSTGLRSANLTSPIAAQSAGRFVRVIVTCNYSTSGPNTAFTDSGSSDVAFNGGTANRTAFFSALSSFPASFNPATGSGISGWQVTTFLPVIMLG